MRFSAEWLDHGISASAELRVTDCLLEIMVGGCRVSRFVDNRANRVHDRVVMPAYPLAEGISRHWWSLLAGRSGEFLLRGFRDGFAVPDIRFRPDGRFVTIAAEPFEYDNPPVSFPTRASERIAVGAFERDMGIFIDTVLDRLEGEALGDTWLRQRRDAIADSLADPDERAFCEAAGALGLDPYCCTDREAALIDRSSGLFAGDALPEFLAGCTPERIPTTLDWIEAAETALGDRAALPDLADIAAAIGERLEEEQAEDRPWMIGYRAAALCREQIGLSPATAFAAPAAIAARFGATRFETVPERIGGLCGEVNGAGTCPRILVAGSRHPATLNFATMRAIGDYMVYRSPGRAPVNDTCSYRQAVGRAFSAEMLAPAALVAQMREDGLGIEEIAAERTISEMAVRHHLENRPLA